MWCSLPGRGELIWRIGGRVRWKVYPGWQVRAMIMFPLKSPDNIGMDGGTNFEVGVRWNWSLKQTNATP